MHAPSRCLGYVLRRLVPKSHPNLQRNLWYWRVVIDSSALKFRMSFFHLGMTVDEAADVFSYYHHHKRTNAENAVAKAILSNFDIQCRGESSTGDMHTERYKGLVIKYAPDSFNNPHQIPE